MILMRSGTSIYKSFDLTWKTVQQMLELGMAIGATIALICVTLYLQYVQEQQYIQEHQDVDSTSDVSHESQQFSVDQVETQDHILILPIKIVKM